MSSLSLLPASTVHRIASSQVITSVSTAIKELVENALDAGADNVEVKLEEHGLSKIEVCDNGRGIKREDAQVMAQRYYTSKINCFENLSELTTYGFRGEALCSLCAVSNVVITTKTKDNAVAVCYTLEQSGKVFSTKPVPSSTGTTVVVTNLFKNLPVRKQFLSSKKKCKEELKKIEELVMSFGCIHPEVRLVLWHNKSIIWQKGKVTDYKTSLVTVLGSPIMAQMDKIEYSNQEDGFEFTGYFPKMAADPSVSCRANNDRCFTFVNNRPVLFKEVYQLVKELYPPAGNKYPIIFLSIKLPPNGVDVNLEPNKTRVLMLEKQSILDTIRAMLEKFYKKEIEIPKEFPNACSEDEETHKNIKNSLDKNSNVEIEDKINNIRQGCSLESNNNTALLSKNEGSSESRHIDDTFNPVVLSTQDKYCPVENNEGLDDLSSQIGCNTNQPEISVQSACLLTETGSVCFEQKCNKTELASLDLRKSAAEMSSNSLLGDPVCIGNVDTVDSITDVTILEQSCGAVSTPSHDTSLLVSVAQESKFENSKQISESSITTLHNYLINDTQTTLDSECRRTDINAINLKENTGLSESTYSKNSNLDLNTQDVNNIYKLLDISEKENSEISYVEEDVVDNVFDDLEFDDILKDVAKKKADQSNHSTLSSESNTQTVVSKVNEIIDLTCANNKEMSSKNWSMGNILKDKQDNVLEPTKLLNPASAKLVIQNNPSILSGKRKHSGDKSLRLKRNKKIKQANQVNQSLIYIHAAQTPQQRCLEAKKVIVPFSMSNLKSCISYPRKSISMSKHQLIGRLEPSGVWLMLKGEDISFLNQYRIQEQILFYKLMQTHSLTVDKLEKSIKLEPRLVGGEECWTILTNLESRNQSLDFTRVIIDERIKSNGFDIRIKQDPDNEDLKIEVIGITTSLPFYGIPDLIEILGLIKDSGTSEGSLSECRPLKVINYLKGEAVRVCRGTGTRMCREEVETMLIQMKKYLPNHVTSCIHHKPFTGHIASIHLP